MANAETAQRHSRILATIAILTVALMPAFSLASTAVNTKGTATIVSLTDGKDVVNQGSALHYVIGVQENTQMFQKMNVLLSLPREVIAAAPDNGGRFVGGQIFWDDVDLTQGLTKMLSATVTLERAIPTNTQLVATAHADGVSVSDATIVIKGAPTSAYTISITDNASKAIPGDRLGYTVKVKNLANYQQHGDLVVYAPDWTDVLSSQPEANVDLPNVTWRDVAFAPLEEKTFRVDTQLRHRMPAYTSVIASATIAGIRATDTTVVHFGAERESIFPFALRSSSSSTASTANKRSGGRSVIFRKTVDSNEVIPGGMLHYTLYVQNLASTSINNAIITDRFDPTKVSFAYGSSVRQLGSGQLRWNVPTLQPGQVWQTTYALSVSPTLPMGSQIVNIATISGDDLMYGSLNEKVSVVQTGVIGELPVTGSPFDLLFVFSSLPLAAAAAGVQKFTRS